MAKDKLGKTIFKWMLLCALPSKSFAATGSIGILGNLDFDKILYNISSAIIPLTQLTLAICFVAGVFFIFRGIAMLHTFGQIQHQMNKPHGITGPFMYIGIGAILIYIPTTVGAVTNTIFGSTTEIMDFFTNSNSENPPQITFSNPDGEGKYTVTNIPNYASQQASELLGYFNIAGGQEWNRLIDVVIQFIQFVGLIAFVRGWFILSHLAEAGGAQQNNFSKGLIHIIGGVLSINFMPFMHIIGSLLIA